MSILIDLNGHMISTKSEAELHHFAQNIGLKPEWFQAPRRAFKKAHYDLITPSMVDKAQLRGAHLVTTRNLIKRAWWSRLITKQEVITNDKAHTHI